MGNASGGDPAIPAGWDDFWEELDDRQDVFRAQTEEYVRNLAATGLLDPASRVLDFGCGFGFAAGGLAARVAELYLWDRSRNMRERAAAATASLRNVFPLDLSADTPAPDRHFDLILVNSVVQYMSRAEFAGWLPRWRQLLTPAGRLVVSDVIPTDRSTTRDVIDLLWFSARRGMFLKALWQAAGEIGRYRKARRTAPLTRFGRQELEDLGREAGLVVSFLPRNLTPFRDRLTLCARPA
jgi:SAM-dependent methyltransferase